jgi:tripartite-type tricarboxylate transporter receptor subunit TctC
MIKKVLLILATTMAVMAMGTGSVFANTNEYKIFLNNPVGSGPDLVARKIQRLVKDQSGIALVIVNQSAGNGLVAAMDFKKERLALMFTITSLMAYLPIQLDSIPYRLDDWDIIAPMGLSGSVFFTQENSSIKHINDLATVLPTLSRGAIAVASADAAANVKAFVNKKNVNVPTVNFKNHNDVVANVIGGNVDVGVVPMTNTMLWNFVNDKKLRVLGVVSNKPFVKDGQTYPSVNQTFNIPAFYGGAWLAITPGNSKERQDLRSVVLSVLKDPELQRLIKETWPLGNVATIESIIETANKHKDLLK